MNRKIHFIKLVCIFSLAPSVYAQKEDICLNTAQVSITTFYNQKASSLKNSRQAITEELFGDTDKEVLKLKYGASEFDNIFASQGKEFIDSKQSEQNEHNIDFYLKKHLRAKLGVKDDTKITQDISSKLNGKSYLFNHYGLNHHAEKVELKESIKLDNNSEDSLDIFTKDYLKVNLKSQDSNEVLSIQRENKDIVVEDSVYEPSQISGKGEAQLLHRISSIGQLDLMDLSAAERDIIYGDSNKKIEKFKLLSQTRFNPVTDKVTTKYQMAIVDEEDQISLYPLDPVDLSVLSKKLAASICAGDPNSVIDSSLKNEPRRDNKDTWKDKSGIPSDSSKARNN